MHRLASLVLLLAAAPAAAPKASAPKAPPEPPYVPAAASDVTGYSETVLPCTVVNERNRYDQIRRNVRCKDKLLESKTLRELTILRNTVYARYGWDGYRKPWLRAYFHSQPWFRPNPKFSYRLINDVDRQNVTLIATREQSFGEGELKMMRDDIYARHGKVFPPDMPSWETTAEKPVKACAPPKDAASDIPLEGDPDTSHTCRYRNAAWYHPDPKFSPSSLTDDERVEVGLISRALGEFALDDGTPPDPDALEKLLSVDQLRQLSLRDLRLLRNTIFARRGRVFQSPILAEHFQNLDWYKPDESYTDARLTKIDRRNVALISSVENELGGPLDDSEWEKGTTRGWQFDAAVGA